MSKQAKLNVYEIVTAQIVALLEEGTVPWRKTWKPADAPRSIHGNVYRGINAFLLAFAPYSDPRWITFNQAKKQGGSVRKGEKSTVVIFWKWIVKEDEVTGRVTRIPFLRYFRVFNVEQCDGLNLKPIADEVREHSPIDACEAIVAEYTDGPSIAHGGDRACYSPRADHVQMPAAESFESDEEYYSTLFHELSHSTGHSSRLDRGLSTGFGSHEYSREELVAEMGAAFLSAEAGIEGAVVENSAAYLAHWSKFLKDDPKAIVVAAAQAQKAADLVLGRKWEDKKEETKAA